MSRKVLFFITSILLLSAAFGSLTAAEYFLEPFGAYVDMPQGWEPLAVTDDKATFTDTAQKGFFQVKVYAPETYDGPEEIFQAVGNELQADAEGDEFLLLGREAAFASLLFAIGEQPYQGFAVFVDGRDFDWAILSFTQMEVFDPYHPFLLSALDSFSIDADALYQPGPVSSYFTAAAPTEDYFQADYDFEGRKFFLEMNGNVMETAEIIVERETAILSRYTPEDEDAWSRFYRMIYRDNYRQLDGLFRQLMFSGIRRDTDPHETASRILTWLQGFTYSRTGTATDFLPPLSALYNMTGDCDSLGLLYVILMKHYGIDSILMVSSRYAHALAAVDVEGQGARFPFQDKAWLVGEITDDVELGLIAADHADPAGWMGISFN